MNLIGAVEAVLDLATFEDEGPWGEGWPSEELNTARDFLTSWVADQKRDADTPNKGPLKAPPHQPRT